MKTSDKTIGYIYTTKDYGKFKHLVGNRDVGTSRISKISKSIEAIGYRTNPIVVNKRFEIIDGQGRFACCKEKGMPIIYVVDESAGLEECQWLNIGCDNWKIEDWIKSYADKGNKDYSELLRLKSECEFFSVSKIVSVCYGVLTNNVGNVIKGGKFKFRISYIEAYDALCYLNRFEKVLKCEIPGTADHLFSAIFFAYQVKGVDLERILERVSEEVCELPGFPQSMKSALSFIENAYNYHLKKSDKRIYLVMEYDKAMRDKFSWYAAKWGIDVEE